MDRRACILAAVIFLLLIQGSSDSRMIPYDSNETNTAQYCDEEGKDVTCSHFKSTLAVLLAQDQSLTLDSEADYDTDVIHCFLNLQVDPNSQIISGTNTVSVKSLIDNLSVFTLDLRDNMIVDNVTGDAASYSRVGHTIEITLNRPFNIGESFDVTVAYHGIPQNLGFSSFNWSSHNGVAGFSTNCEPWFAHTWWPCKDVLRDKFTLDVWITVPDWMIANSNGILMGADTVTGDKIRYRWQESYPVIAYLVCMAGTNYVNWTYDYNYDGGTMPVDIYAYPENEATARTNTSNLITQIQTFSRSDVFGQYPFINEKYGITQVPSGGMENQTLSSQGSFSAFLNAHELAHQWWGDMITCATWHDIWLNEGFATYAEAVYEEKKPGGSYTSYLNRLQVRRPGSYGGTVYVYDITDVSTIFDHTTVYSKAAWVLHMLRHVVKDANFFNTLAAYRSDFEGGSATTEDFTVVAESVYGGDLQWFFDEWIYNGGAPNYRFGWQQQQIGSQNWLRLYIQQFQSTGNLNFQMPIDITVNTGISSSTIPVWNNARSQWYLLKTDAPAASVQFDKDTWILRGAATPISYIQGPAKIIDTLPSPGQSVYTAADTNRVVIQFSQAITYSDSDITVIGSLSGPRAFSSSYSADDYKLTLSFLQLLPENETWTVTVSDNILTQPSGYAIDGEFTESALFPSGDGIPGGDAVFSFYVGYAADLQKDGIVNLADFALFTPHWLKADCGLCDGADLTGDGNVGSDDLEKFVSSWLAGI